MGTRLGSRVALASLVLIAATGTAPAGATAVPDDVDWQSLYFVCQGQLNAAGDAPATIARLESHIAMLEAQQDLADKTVRGLGHTLERKDRRIKELWAMVHEARKS